MGRMSTKPIYFDYASATLTDSRVVKAMLPYFTDNFGNPSSSHNFGKSANQAVENSKKNLAKFINCLPEEIIFTSGGTESNNLALIGILRANKNRGKHIVTSNIEHPSIQNTCRALEKDGFKVTYVAVERNGQIDLNKLTKAIHPDTVLVSTFYGNSEIGSLNPIREMAKICHTRGVVFHVDACQVMSYLKVDVRNLGVDLLTFNGSKMAGPKGVGVLFVKKGLDIYPIIYGGGQQASLRSGTENVPGIVGISKAAQIVKQKYNFKRVKNLRDNLEKKLSKIPGLRVNLAGENRLPNHLSLTFLHGRNRNYVREFNDRGIALSAGSACSAKSLVESHVLTGIGLTPLETHNTVRITLGCQTTRAECEQLLKVITKII